MTSVLGKMRRPIIFKDHCDDELPWACCYEDDESNVEWSEGRFYIGFGKTAVEAYGNWRNKKVAKLDVEGLFILDAQTAMDMLDSPPEPNEKLIELLRMK